MDILTSFIVPFIIVLGVLIFIHEFGHFIVAKRLGVRVEKFSLGFGPRLVGFTRGETEYRISLLPLGGYVKLAGEEPGEDATSDPGEFSSRSVGDRAKIVLAGPLMNLILPFFFFPIVFMLGTEMPAYLKETPVVGWVDTNSPAESAGIMLDDRIVAVNGTAVKNWGELETRLATNPDTTLEISLVRDEATVVKEMTTIKDDKFGIGYGGIGRHIDPLIRQLTPGYPAEQAGLQVGDLILAIQGEPVSHWNQISPFIKKYYGDDIEFTIQRGEETLFFTFLTLLALLMYENIS